MGTLFGGRLAQAGNNVTMVDVNPSVIDSINARGIILEDEEGTHQIPAAACRGDELEEPQDLVLLFTKTMYSRAALESAKGFIGSGTTVLTLQNGLGNIELIEGFVGRSQILAGVTNYASDVTGPGTIRTEGAGFVRFYSADGKMRPAVAAVGDALAKAGFAAEIFPDVLAAIWEKAAFNAAINSTCALAQVPCGGIGKVAEGRDLAFQIAREAASVAQASGIGASQDRVISSLEYSFVHHKDHYPSMAQDVMKKRRTEIGSINGEIVRQGEAKGIPVPFTKAVFELMKVVEAPF
jgi:2-dehydropantoate 2-reductase